MRWSRCSTLVAATDLLVVTSVAAEIISKDETDSYQEPGLLAAVGGVVLLTCLLLVCLCCICRLKRPREEPESALQIAERREREEEEAHREQQREFDAATIRAEEREFDDEAGSNVAMGGNEACDVMDWHSDPGEAEDLSPPRPLQESQEIPPNPESNDEATSSKADPSCTSAKFHTNESFASDSEPEGNTPKSSPGAPIDDQSSRDVNDLRICWIEEEVQDMRGAQHPAHMSCCGSSMCQQNKIPAKAGGSRSVCAGLARLVSL